MGVDYLKSWYSDDMEKLIVQMQIFSDNEDDKVELINSNSGRSIFAMTFGSHY